MKLTKKDLAERAEVLKALEDRGAKLVDAVNAFNAAMETQYMEVHAAQADYQTALERAKDFAEQISSDAQSEFDDRSEKWQESDAGRRAAAFISTWQDIADNLMDENDLEDRTRAPNPIEEFAYEDDYQAIEGGPESDADA